MQNLTRCYPSTNSPRGAYGGPMRVQQNQQNSSLDQKYHHNQHFQTNLFHNVSQFHALQASRELREHAMQKKFLQSKLLAKKRNNGNKEEGNEIREIQMSNFKIPTTIESSPQCSGLLPSCCQHRSGRTRSYPGGRAGRKDPREPSPWYQAPDPVAYLTALSEHENGVSVKNTFSA